MTRLTDTLTRWLHGGRDRQRREERQAIQSAAPLVRAAPAPTPGPTWPGRNYGFGFGAIARRLRGRGPTHLKARNKYTPIKRSRPLRYWTPHYWAVRCAELRKIAEAAGRAT